MNILLVASALVSSASLLGWLWLVLARGLFWRTDQRLPPGTPERGRILDWPGVSVVIPARDEAGILPSTLPSLLGQDYPGAFHVFLVDDQSQDGTSETARQIADDVGAGDRLTTVHGQPLPSGWTGKVWALQQGVRASERTESEFLLLTDADIAHAPDNLRKLVAHARSRRLDLASVMARLRVQTVWDRLLIPAFVYFFAKLYPFRWASDPGRSTAAAAGGCLLVRRAALGRSGGLKRISNALIDDCALAGLIKKGKGEEGAGRTWLGLSQGVRSQRAYGSLKPTWDMVARSAFAQLSFSPFLLTLTVLGMLFLYVVPPLAALGGLVAVVVRPGGASVSLFGTGLAAWALIGGSYVPMLRWHGTSPLFAPLLPLAAGLYTLMTVDSAVRWWRGRGGGWKGRTYDPAGPQSGRAT